MNDKLNLLNSNVIAKGFWAQYWNQETILSLKKSITVFSVMAEDTHIQGKTTFSTMSWIMEKAGKVSQSKQS